MSHRMLNVAVAEISLRRARIACVIRQLVATRVPQHVRMGLKSQFGLLPCPFDYAGDPAVWC